METDELKLREHELKNIVKAAIRISEESCTDAFNSKSLSGDLGMQRFVFQESFKLVLADLLGKKPKGTPDYGLDTLQQTF